MGKRQAGIRLAYRQAGMEVVKRNETGKWKVLPKRWIVERTFAWLLNFRRLVMDYERTVESASSYIYIAMMILMGKNIN